MDRLWAPWRMTYIKSEKSGECVFCKAAADPDQDKENLVLWRGEYGYVILNRFPYNNGHLMVVPYRHVPSIEDLEPAPLADLMTMVQEAIALLRRAMQPDGFNVGINLGEAAGAGIVAHVHIHIVPRWNGDTNFMPVLGGVRVIPDALENTYKSLLDVLRVDS
jgi:ATP adenylyltransferase